jgi:trimeric autotransporter adhesin
MKTSLVLVVACALHSFQPSTAHAQPCNFDWDVSIGNPGMDYEVTSLAVHDDGAGLSLFAGGRFRSAGGTPAMRIARWDGKSWSALGTGIGGDENDYASYVYAMTSFDDGNGPVLFAGGTFNRAGDQAAISIAAWRDGQWSALGLGLRDEASSGEAKRLVVFDDGSGPALYAAGRFDSAGGIPAANIARWDGQNWSALGTGVRGTVRDMAVYDDGSGPATYVTGTFYETGGISIIEKWDGRGWQRTLGGAPRGSWENYRPCPIGPFCPIYNPPDGDAVGVFDSGSGESLYLSGFFSRIGRFSVRNLAAWSGRRWSSLNGGHPDVGIVDMVSFDDGSGPALYAGGWDVGIARWNGSTWSELGTGIIALPVHAMIEFDDGSGDALYVAGQINAAGGQTTHNIARWKCPL